MDQNRFTYRARLAVAKFIAPRVRNPQREIWPYGDGSPAGYRLRLSRVLPELRLDPYGLALAAETTVWAKACIDLRKSAVSRMPCAIYDAQGNKLEDTPFHAMMKYARLTYQQNLFALWEQSLSVHGEMYAEKLNNSDIPGLMIPGGIRILNAIAITPQVQQGHVTWYQYSASGGIYKLYPEDLFIHRYGSLTDDFRASAPMITAMDAIGIKRNMQSYLRGFFDNDATPGGLVTPKAGVTVNTDWVNRIMGMWVDAFKGSNNRNSTGFIPSEIDYEQFDNKMPEHQQELSDDQIAEICAAFRVPVGMVKSGGVKDPLGGGGKMDSDRQMFYEDFVEPECEDIETYINDVIIPWLMPNSGVKFSFDYDETRSLIRDTKERSDKVRAEFAEGTITFNEMRIALDYEPVEGGDWYQFTPGKVLIPAANIGNAPALLAPPPPPAPPMPPAPAALPTPPVMPQLAANVPPPPAGKSAAVMLDLGNHPDLIGLQNKTRAYVGETPVKWSDPTSFHVTLASMPSVTDEQLKALQTTLEDVDAPEMNLKVGSLGTFDNLDSHAVHFKVRKSPDLLDLQETLHELISGLGIPMSAFSTPEAYKPHVTMGYADSKPPARTFDSRLMVKPTALHLGVGDEIVYKKPIGDVITPEPPPTPEDKPKVKSDGEFESVGILKKIDGKWVKQSVSSESPVISYAESALDELAQWEKKVKNKGVKVAFVNYLIRDEVADYLRDNLLLADGNPGAIKATFEEVKTRVSVKAIQATRLDFENEFDDLLSRARNDEATRQQFRSKLASLLNTYGKRAYTDGLTDGGIDDPELSDDDSNEIAGMLADQSQYVSGISDTLFKGDGVTDGQADMKAAAWYNKSIAPFYQAGLASADADSLYEWVEGDTSDKCPDCVRMNGQRHRLKQYKAKTLMPPTDTTECRGFACKCKLVKVAGKARGNWLSAAKSEDVEAHTHEAEPVLE